jgi:hypothetical protein
MYRNILVTSIVVLSSGVVYTKANTVDVSANTVNVDPDSGPNEPTAPPSWTPADPTSGGGGGLVMPPGYGPAFDPSLAPVFPDSPVTQDPIEQPLNPTVFGATAPPFGPTETLAPPVGPALDPATSFDAPGAAVPLPPAIWGGASLLVLVGGLRSLDKRRVKLISEGI